MADFQEQYRRSMEQLQKVLKSTGGGSGGSGGAGRAARAGGLGAMALLGIIGLGYGAVKSIYSVDAGHRAIKFNRLTGVGNKIFGEGVHLMMPWVERPIIYDIRTRPNSITSLTGSRDLQMVNLTLRVLHRPDESNLQRMYRELGLNYAERVLPSIANEVLKSVVAQFEAAEMLTKRKMVSDAIRVNLVNRASDFGILIDDVSITHLQFGAEYSAAVEAKQVAHQEAERAKFVVQKASQEKKSMILRAEGETEAIRLVSEAMSTSRGFLELRKIEAAKDVAKIVSKSQNKIYLESNSLLINQLGAALSEESGKKA